MQSLELNTDVSGEMLYEYHKKYTLKNMFYWLRGEWSLVPLALCLLTYFLLDFLGYYPTFTSILFLYIALCAAIAFSDLSNLKKNCMKWAQYHSEIGGKKTFIITPAGISLFYKGAEKFTEWEQCQSTYESKRVIAIIFKTGRMIYINKSAFQSKEDFEFFKRCSEDVKRGITEKYD